MERNSKNILLTIVFERLVFHIFQHCFISSSFALNFRYGLSDRRVSDDNINHMAKGAFNHNKYELVCPVNKQWKATEVYRLLPNY